MATKHDYEEGLDEVKVQKLSHAVAQRLRARIVDGQLKPGDKLPSETELLEQFKVSRPTVREALRILEVEALIAMGRGMRFGATVLAPSPERAASYAAMVLASNGTTFGEVHEARIFMEPALVFQLAKKRDADLLGALRGLLAQAKEALGAEDYALALRSFSEFHAALVRAASNRAVGLVLSILRDLSAQSQGEFSERSADLLADATPRELSLKVQLQKTLKAYQELVHLMEEGRAAEAQEHWRKYMVQVAGFMDKAGLAARQMQHQA